MRLQSCPALETVPTLNTKCFCFVFFFIPPPAHFPPQWIQRRQRFYEPATAKRFWGPQCVHSSLDSSALGRAFKCEGTMRRFKRKVRQQNEFQWYWSFKVYEFWVLWILRTKRLSCLIPSRRRFTAPCAQKCCFERSFIFTAIVQLNSNRGGTSGPSELSSTQHFTLL